MKRAILRERGQPPKRPATESGRGTASSHGAASSRGPTADATGEAERALRSQLLGLWQSGRLHSSDLCQLAQAITRAGGRGVADLGHDAENSSRHLRGALGLTSLDKDLYWAMIPTWDKE